MEAIGGVFNDVAQALPFAHALDAARDVLLQGAGFAHIATDLLRVGGYSVGTVATAVVVFRRRMAE